MAKLKIVLLVLVLLLGFILRLYKFNGPIADCIHGVSQIPHLFLEVLLRMGLTFFIRVSMIYPVLQRAGTILKAIVL